MNLLSWLLDKPDRVLWLLLSLLLTPPALLAVIVGLVFTCGGSTPPPLQCLGAYGAPSFSERTP